jgi:hypothetical protein
MQVYRTRASLEECGRVGRVRPQEERNSPCFRRCWQRQVKFFGTRRSALATQFHPGCVSLWWYVPSQHQCCIDAQQRVPRLDSDDANSGGGPNVLFRAQDDVCEPP